MGNGHSALPHDPLDSTANTTVVAAVETERIEKVFLALVSFH